MEGSRSSGAGFAVSGSQHGATLVDACIDDAEVVILCMG